MCKDVENTVCGAASGGCRFAGTFCLQARKSIDSAPTKAVSGEPTPLYGPLTLTDNVIARKASVGETSEKSDIQSN